jgi:Phycobilisome protein
MTLSPVPSLAQQWAHRYVNNLLPDSALSQETWATPSRTRRQVRARIADKLLQSLRTTSLQAWSRTETLLADEVRRHQIEPSLINPWQISADVHKIYEKVLKLYSEAGELFRLPTAIAPEIGQIRRRYTEVDPRVIGYVSMQFHYTGVLLKSLLSPGERVFIEDCFKIVDDHLYMPLHRAYAAAGKLPYDSPALKVVQKLLPHSTEIAKQVVQRVHELYPSYTSYSGFLTQPEVKVSSIRDAEMFQIYLWVCVLEQNFSAIQSELFPLCVMLYPRLGVHWELVRQMVHLLGQSIRSRLGAEAGDLFMPYFSGLRDMFSPYVFPE